MKWKYSSRVSLLSQLGRTTVILSYVLIDKVEILPTEPVAHSAVDTDVPPYSRETLGVGAV